MLSKKDLKHLAELARIELSTQGGSASGGKENESDKLQKDLGSILDHFKELQELNTDNVEPMVGGTELKSVVREDEAELEIGNKELGNKAVEAFPEKQDGYLKVPPVF